MTLSELVKLFEGQDGERHTAEVSLTDLRTWYGDQQEIMRINNMLLAGLQRIDGINDNPAHYSAEINAVLDPILRSSK